MKFLKAIWDLLKKGWDILRAVYWFNSLPWRILKSGALVVLGFFCLAGSNLLHSFKPDWEFLNFFKSYGFLLIVYGPIHHLIIIPGSLALNHYDWGREYRLGKRIPFWTLISFFCIVVVLGLNPLDIMNFGFKSSFSTSTPDVDPKISCWIDSGRETISCRIPNERGIDKVEVHNGGNVMKTDSEVPYNFTFKKKKLSEVVGQKTFFIVLRDKQNQLLRRYRFTISMLDTRNSSDTVP